MPENAYSESISGKNSVSENNIIDHSKTNCEFYYKTYSRRLVFVWPPLGNPRDQFCIRDIANNLAKTTYFPETECAPFTAAQYACELAAILAPHSAEFQLRAMLLNAFEAYTGHVSLLVRQAERNVTPPAQLWDRRDELETSLQTRIRAGLGIPDLPKSEIHTFNTASTYARWKLDATLERDIGACIYPARSQMDGSVLRITEPLPRRLSPMSWDKAEERYLRTYKQLALMAGVRGEE